LAAEFIGEGPREVLLVGVIPARVELQTGLSDVAKSSLTTVEEKVFDELSRIGLEVEKRSQPIDPHIWWE
jgi:hypothetical protein